MQAFISYPRERQDDAVYLATAIRNRGFQVFLDQESIKPGQDWDEAIRTGIDRSRIFVILFDPAAATENRYFSIEIDEIEERLPEQDTLGLVVLYGDDAAAHLPPKLARFHALSSAGPRERWVAAVLKAALPFRQRSRRLRMLRWGLAAAVVAIVTLSTVLFVRLRREELPQVGRVRMVDDTCVKLISGLGTSGLTEFANDAARLWLVGQSLKDVIDTEQGFLLEHATGEGSEVRILLMAREDEEGGSSTVVDAMAEWSTNPDSYPMQIEISHQILHNLVAQAEQVGGHLEARATALVPFSAVVVDWDEEAAKIQFLPKLYRVPGGSRPILQFERRCNAKAFDDIVRSLESAWSNATPLQPPS